MLNTKSKKITQTIIGMIILMMFFTSCTIKYHNDNNSSSSNLVKHLVMGEAEITVKQAESYLHRINPDAPYYASIYQEEAKKENVRWDIAFAQSLLETNYFRFGGDVSKEQNNFAGLGATGNGVKGITFTSINEGIKAQIQHLKAYASVEKLNEKCIDERFEYVTRGVAPYIEDFGSGIWAMDPTGYGRHIYQIVNKMKQER